MVGVALPESHLYRAVRTNRPMQTVHELFCWLIWTNSRDRHYSKHMKVTTCDRDDFARVQPPPSTRRGMETSQETVIRHQVDHGRAYMILSKCRACHFSLRARSVTRCNGFYMIVCVFADSNGCRRRRKLGRCSCTSYYYRHHHLAAQQSLHPKRIQCPVVNPREW